MAQKRIDIKFNVDDKSVKIAGEETMKLSQQVRLLKAELASGKYSQEEFEILAKKLGDVQDQMAKAKARSGDLFTSLQLIPGPVGEIASKINGAIALMKQFGGFSFSDLKFQFKETIDDVKEIGTSLFKNLGITKTYETINNALARSFVAVGVGEQAAATGARAFSAALTATGIGAIVVALGLLIANWEEVTDAIMGATAESKVYDEAQADVTKGLAEFNKKLIDVNNSFKQAKAGTISKEDALKKYNDTLGSTVGYAGSLEQAEQLLAENTAVVVEGIKLRTQANVFYAKSAEAAAKAVSGEDIDPSVWQTITDYVLAGGQAQFFYANQVGSTIENLAEFQNQAKIFEKEGDALTQKAIENDQKLKKGLAKPPETKATKEAVKSTIDEYKKAYQEVTLAQMTEREREEAIVKEKYANFIKLAKENGKETKTFEDALAKDLLTIQEKYQKIEDKKQEERLKKEQELQNQLRTLEAQRTQTLIDDAEAEVLITQQKYDALIALAVANNEETATLEALKAEQIDKIRTDATAKENERLASDTEKRKQDNLKLLQDEQAYEQQRLAMKTQALDGIIQLAGAETAVGRAALVAKQLLLAKELVLEVKKNIAFSKSALARSQVAVAEGTAQTAKIGFPQNIIPLALYAVQAASIIGSIISATRASKTSVDVGGIEAGAGTTPTSAPAPTGVVAKRNQGGFVYGDGGSITDSIPTMLSNGEFVMNAKSASMFSPILTAMNNMGNLPNTAIPQALGNQSLVDVMSQGMNNRPIKTYVTAQDMSNQQQFDRTIKSRSLI